MVKTGDLHWTVKSRLPDISASNQQLSIHFPLSLILIRVMGGLKPIPADLGREVGYTLDKSHIHTYGHFRVTS